jgi:predicted membrane channel-forming protein YqfA (hemolysin III family)
VHLVPWASIRVEELVTRLDRAGIIAICGASFMFPQLVERGICRATPLFSLATVALPCIVGAGRVLLGHGNDSYSVGISMGIAAISTTGFLACYVDTQAATWSIVTVLLYGTGMLVYALKPFADAPFSMVFDFHDIIMHCLVKKPPGLFQTRWGCSTLARFATRHDMGLDPVFCALASKRLECLRKQWATGAL